MLVAILMLTPFAFNINHVFLFVIKTKQANGLCWQIEYWLLVAIFVLAFSWHLYCMNIL
jgi:hypothetical protein